YLTVVIAIYLARLGLDTIQVGLVLSAAIFGSALMTVLWALVADRYGRRRTVATMATLMIAGGMIFAFGSTFPLLLLGAFTGTISRSEEHTSELQSPCNLVCRLLLEKKKKEPLTYINQAQAPA